MYIIVHAHTYISSVTEGANATWTGPRRKEVIHDNDKRTAKKGEEAIGSETGVSRPEQPAIGDWQAKVGVARLREERSCSTE